MKTIYIVIGAVVLAVVAAGGGFFGGLTYAQSQSQNTVSDFARQRGIQGQQGNSQNGSGGANNPCGFGQFESQDSANGGAHNGEANPGSGQGNSGAEQPRGQFGGNFGNLAQFGNCVARGQIKSVNGSTVEISTANSVVTVRVNDKTLISKTDAGTLADLQPGGRVTVFSQESGSNPTASAIQLLPSAQPAPQQ